MKEILISSLAYNTQTGCVYVYLEESKDKKHRLYNNGSQWFVKSNGKNIFFKSEEDIKRIKKFLD